MSEAQHSLCADQCDKIVSDIMLKVIHLKDKSSIFSFLSRTAELQVYCIGDLDDFFWPHTTWFGLAEDENILSIALLYTGLETPTLLCFYESRPEYPLELLKRIRAELPSRLYTHLSPGLTGLFKRDSKVVDFGAHYKMTLKRIPENVNDDNIRRLSGGDLSSILTFYTASYPGNWFDGRMLETGKYFGYFMNGMLIGIAGIHVYSEKYRIAALGNIATHPDYRGQQIAYKLTSVLCKDIKKNADVIGLNVKADNEFAIRCYQKAGFEVVGEYDESLVESV